MSKVNIQFKKETDEDKARDILLKEGLMQSMLWGPCPCLDRLDMENWIYLVPHYQGKIAGIVLLNRVGEKSYNIHVGLYKEFFGKAYFLGYILFNHVLPVEFSGCKIIARMSAKNRHSRLLAKKTGFIPDYSVDETVEVFGKKEKLYISYYEVK